MDERRKAKRLDMAANLVMKRLDSGETKNAKIDVLDVSRTGIGFICDEELEIGAKYEASLTIWTGDTIHAFIEIVRKSQEEGGGIYGGIFVGMPEADWCRIRVYETYQEYAPEENK